MSRPVAKNTNKRRKKSKKDDKNENDKQDKPKLSKKFIDHIVELGFDAKDAARLYENKDDWLGMSSGGKVLCTQQGCKFSGPLCSDALFDHCRTVHGWRDYPCTHDNCDFVAYSSTCCKKTLVPVSLAIQKNTIAIITRARGPTAKLLLRALMP